MLPWPPGAPRPKEETMSCATRVCGAAGRPTARSATPVAETFPTRRPWLHRIAPPLRAARLATIHRCAVPFSKRVPEPRRQALDLPLCDDATVLQRSVLWPRARKELQTFQDHTRCESIWIRLSTPAAGCRSQDHSALSLCFRPIRPMAARPVRPVLSAELQAPSASPSKCRIIYSGKRMRRALTRASGAFIAIRAVYRSFPPPLAQKLPGIPR